MFLRQTDKKRDFRREETLGNTFLWCESNLCCVICDVGVLRMEEKALELQGVQKPQAGSLFSRAL